jgi:hypothetical protein
MKASPEVIGRDPGVLFAFTPSSTFGVFAVSRDQGVLLLRPSLEEESNPADSGIVGDSTRLTQVHQMSQRNCPGAFVSATVDQILIAFAVVPVIKVVVGKRQ